MEWHLIMKQIRMLTMTSTNILGNCQLANLIVYFFLCPRCLRQRIQARIPSIAWNEPIFGSAVSWGQIPADQSRLLQAHIWSPNPSTQASAVPLQHLCLRSTPVMRKRRENAATWTSVLKIICAELIEQVRRHHSLLLLISELTIAKITVLQKYAWLNVLAEYINYEQKLRLALFLVC